MFAKCKNVSKMSQHVKIKHILKCNYRNIRNVKIYGSVKCKNVKMISYASRHV